MEQPTQYPPNQRNLNVQFAIKSPGSPGFKFVRRATDIPNACAKLKGRLIAMRNEAFHEGDIERLNNQRLRKKFINWILCAIVEINGHLFHSNLVVFRLQDHAPKNFNFEQFWNSINTFFQFEGLKYIKIKLTSYTRNNTTNNEIFHFNYRFFCSSREYSVSEFVRRLCNMCSLGIKDEQNVKILIPNFGGFYNDENNLTIYVDYRENLLSHFQLIDEENISPEQAEQNYINSYPSLLNFFQQLSAI